MNRTIGVDIGGTGTRIAIVTHPDGTLDARRSIATAQIGARGGRAAVADLAEAIRHLQAAQQPITSIGIGASGPVDPSTGIIDNPHTLPWFTGTSLTDALAEELGVPVAIDNDTLAAALGEYTYGAAAGSTRALTVTLGTGIGVALIDNGQPFRGGGGSHPEAGHIPITDRGPRCYCGLTGCWEPLAARTALDHALAAHWPADVTTRPAWLAQNAHTPAIAEVLTRYGRHVGTGLAILHAVYRPEITIIGGAAAEYLPHYASAMHRAMRRNPPFDHAVTITTAELGDWAGAIGASLFTSAGESGRP
jgi:glucokinase